MNTKKSFPCIEKIRIDVIAPREGGKVYPDFEGEISKLGRYAELVTHFTEVGISTDLDQEAKQKRTQEYSRKIAKTIQDDCNGDVLVIIRGGGNGYEFKVYGEPELIAAFRNSPAYKVIGIGHSENYTKLDKFADAVERTPGQAGVYIREHHQKNIDQINTSRTQPVSNPPQQLNESGNRTLASNVTGGPCAKGDARSEPKSSMLWIVIPAIVAVSVIVFLAWQPTPIPKPAPSETSPTVTENHPKFPHREKLKATTAFVPPSSSQPQIHKSDQERITERLHAVESGASLAPAPMFNQGTK